MIVALTGPARSGKDTVAAYLCRHHEFTRLAFGDIIRAEIAEAWGISLQVFADETQKEIPHPNLGIQYCTDQRFVQHILSDLSNSAQKRTEAMQPRSPRWLMQQWGDYRRKGNSDYFTRQLLAQIARTPGHIVISDVRSNAEAHDLSRLSADIWRIDRPDVQPVNAHHTEHGISNYYIDRAIKNHSTTHELGKQIWLALHAMLYANQEAA